MATANKIEVSFRRVEIETGMNLISIVDPIMTILSRVKGKPVEARADS
jgi:hypothetical protein